MSLNLPFRRALLSSAVLMTGLILSIDTGGWTAQHASPPTFLPDSVPIALPLHRTGYDANANFISFTESVILTQRVRQTYPNQALLTTNTVALADFIYATDTGNGVVNNSSLTSPVPIANWAMPHRQIVGNTLALEVVAFHRNARNGYQVACVKFIATDGTNTVSTIVSTTAPSGRTGDRNSVLTYACSLDISSLTDNHLITVNAEVYPWVGSGSSIAKSANSSVAREFSPRYFLKNTTLAANPVYAYVASGGNDTTGAVSTTAATAAAAPCATVVGAINRIIAVNGKVDGCIIRVGSGTFTLDQCSSTRTQNVGVLKITRDPTVAVANSIVSFGLSNTNFRPFLGGSLTSPVTTGAIMFDDITISRTGTGNFQGEAAADLEVIFNNIASFDNGSNNFQWLNRSHDYCFGVNFINAASVAFTASTYEHRCWRGVTVDLNGGTPEGWLSLGCKWTRAGATANGTRSFSGGIWAFNWHPNVDANTGAISIGQSADVNGYAIVQNVFEFCSATANPAVRISADSFAGNTVHVVIFNNTVAGFFNNARANIFYDEGPTHRTHTLHACKGNIWVQLNTKQDVFRAINQGDTAGAPTRTGGWTYMYGVGCQGEWSQFADSSGAGLGSPFAQAYPGLGANIGTSSTARNDPKFVDYEGTTSGPTAGSGNGNYVLQVSSGCRGMLKIGVLSHDLAGNPRAPANDVTGAYAA